MRTLSDTNLCVRTFAYEPFSIRTFSFTICDRIRTFYTRTFSVTNILHTNLIRYEPFPLRTIAVTNLIPYELYPIRTFAYEPFPIRTLYLRNFVRLPFKSSSCLLLHGRAANFLNFLYIPKCSVGSTDNVCSFLPQKYYVMWKILMFDISVKKGLCDVSEVKLRIWQRTFHAILALQIRFCLLFKRSTNIQGW